MEVNWISVKEKLPELKLSISNGFMWESDVVLVCGKWYGAGLCCYYADKGKKKFWWWSERHGIQLDELITHWMPVPKFPEFD